MLSIWIIGFDLAPAVKDLEIVGHSCDYYANPSSGGISGNFGVDTKTCELDVPQREQISYRKTFFRYIHFF